MACGKEGFSISLLLLLLLCRFSGRKKRGYPGRVSLGTLLGKFGSLHFLSTTLSIISWFDVHSLVSRVKFKGWTLAGVLHPIGGGLVPSEGVFASCGEALASRGGLPGGGPATDLELKGPLLTLLCWSSLASVAGGAPPSGFCLPCENVQLAEDFAFSSVELICKCENAKKNLTLRFKHFYQIALELHFKSYLSL